MFGLAILFGCVVGFSLGLTGGGGGVFAVPLLVHGLTVAPREAIGISLASVGGTALFVLVSISGVTSHLFGGSALSLQTTLPFMLGGFAGMWLGGIVAQRLQGPTLQKAFSIAVAMVAIFMIFKSVVL